MLGWIAKLLLLIAVLTALGWVKYAFVSSSFKLLFNQFYFFKNMSFFNVFWTAQSWLTTQKMTLTLSPKTLVKTMALTIEDLLPKIYDKIDTFTFIFQFNNLMVIDDEFSTFYSNILRQDNCALIEELPIRCETQFARDIFANSYRSSIAFSYLTFNKLNVIFQANNKTDPYKTYLNSIIDLKAITETSYQYSNQKHQDPRHSHRTNPGPNSPVH